MRLKRAGEDPAQARKRLRDSPKAGLDDSADEDFLSEWERRTRPVVVIAALLPIVSALTDHGEDNPFVVVDIASWLVFLIDFVVHFRRRRQYLGNWWGRFDLLIVVATFPFYLLPGVGVSQATQLLRLGRLARIAMVGSDAPVVRGLFDRLGKPLLYTTIILAMCSWIVYLSDGSEYGFDSMWDGLWWGIVTLTTVGYGDYTPHTTIGRWAGVVLMISGLALVGTLAGSLSSIFRLEDNVAEQEAEQTERDRLHDDLRELRSEVSELHRLIRALQPDQRSPNPPEPGS